MKEGYTHISVVIDESGSMMSILNDTIGGFNTFLETQKETPGEATFSLTKFSNKTNLVYSFMDIKEVPVLTKSSYRPSGGTALYDAIGETIIGCGNKLAAMQEYERPDKVMIVIITDGEENVSREFTHANVQQMIKHQSDIYKWEFVFLGANINAERTAVNLNIKLGNTMTFAATSDGVDATFKSMSSKLSSYRGMSGQSISSDYSFFDSDDRAAQAKAGVTAYDSTGKIK